MFVFGGGGYPIGPFYHETFDRATGVKVGDTYTLEYSGSRVNLAFCWEAQGRYVVYYDTRGRFLWVVPVPSRARNAVESSPALLRGTEARPIADK